MEGLRRRPKTVPCFLRRRRQRKTRRASKARVTKPRTVPRTIGSVSEWPLEEVVGEAEDEAADAALDEDGEDEDIVLAFDVELCDEVVEVEKLEVVVFRAEAVEDVVFALELEVLLDITIGLFVLVGVVAGTSLPVAVESSVVGESTELITDKPALNSEEMSSCLSTSST